MGFAGDASGFAEDASDSAAYSSAARASATVANATATAVCAKATGSTDATEIETYGEEEIAESAAEIALETSSGGAETVAPESAVVTESVEIEREAATWRAVRPADAASGYPLGSCF